MPNRPWVTCEKCGDKHACKASYSKKDDEAKGGDGDGDGDKTKTKTKVPAKKAGSVLRELLGF